jgi:hypothetical protein
LADFVLALGDAAGQRLRDALIQSLCFCHCANLRQIVERVAIIAGLTNSHKGEFRLLADIFGAWRHSLCLKVV